MSQQLLKDLTPKELDAKVRREGFAMRTLRRLFDHKDIGWDYIREQFTRFYVFRGKRFQVFLHRIRAPMKDEWFHDHPWDFTTFILWGGYHEQSQTDGHLVGKERRRLPGMVLRRKAEHRHITYCKNVSWSLVFAGPKRRGWGYFDVAGKPRVRDFAQMVDEE